jgi:hypothetical protein
MDQSGNRPGETTRGNDGRDLVGLAARNNLLVGLLATLAVVLLLIAPELMVADSWMTLLAGREVIEHGLPSTEELTLWPLGREWVDQQWLAQALFYGSWSLGGLRLALLLDVVLVVLALALAMVAARLRGGSARSTLFAATACVLMAPWAWQLRAQTVALPLFVGVLALVTADVRLARRRTLLVFGLLVLWANVHGSVVLGAAIVAWAGLLCLVAHVRGADAPGPARSLLYLLAPWACVIASPYALDLPGYYRLMLVDSPVSKVIVEWQAPRPSGYMLIFFVVAAATVVVAVWQRRRLSAYDLGVLALTLAGSLRSGRGIVWFALAVAVLLPVAIDGILGGDAGPVRRRVGAWVAGVAVAATLVGAVAAMSREPSWYERTWPDEAVRAVMQAAEGGGARAVLPSDKHADWLLWKLPELRGRTAYDVRFELLTAAELESIVRYKSLQPGWDDRTRGYRVVVVDPRDTPAHVERLLDLGLEVRYRDGDVVVLTRRAAS